MLVVKMKFHSFILSRERTREKAGKVGHGDEDEDEDEEDEEGIEYPVVKMKSVFLSFFLSPMPVPLPLYWH